MNMSDTKSTNKIIRIYNIAAIGYDIEATLTGFSKKSAIRRDAIESLELKKNEIVLDVCCGTGLNFEILEQHIGKDGEIIGIDINSNMLRITQRRCEKNNWKNIDLVNTNILEFNTEKPGDCALCTVAMGTIPEYEKAIYQVMKQLKSTGRFSIVDGKFSDRFPYKLLNRPYDLFSKSGGFDYKKRDLIKYIKSNYKVVFYREYGGGFCYSITFENN
jgi:demethylmenaquinone methyltransferase/2-methoxy-6-polyprenyl-1,4-benzoquinol methylase